MRESVGATALFYIFAVFLIIIAFIIGFTINYMSAYRANNFLISELEQHDGGFRSELRDSAQLNQYVSENYGYNLHVEGVDFQVLPVSGSAFKGGSIVRVYTYMNFKVPLIAVKIPVKVRGETRTIQGVDAKTACQNLKSSVPSGTDVDCPNEG